MLERPPGYHPPVTASCVRVAFALFATALLPACGGDHGARVTPLGPGFFDTVKPAVSSTIPASAATGIPLNSAVTAAFSEPIDAATVTTSSFTLAAGPAPVAGTVSAAGSSATFTPAAPLAASTLFTATLTTAVKDLAGNPLVAAFVWTFTTGVASDLTPPSVVSTLPAVAAAGVALNAAITATFDEAMNPSTLTGTTFTLTDGLAAVAGSVNTSGATATFSPAADLLASTAYTATITTGAQDLAGNALAADFIWTFTTGVAGDTTAPTVASAVPAAGAGGVPLNAVATATFDEPMDPATISSATLLLAQGASPVAGTVTYDAPSLTATFTPSAPLANAKTYTATVKTGAQDLAGNAVAADFTWIFTTVPDTTAPTVVSNLPATGAIGVSTAALVTVTFSEPMNPATLNATTFTVLSISGGGLPVAGIVTYAGTTATFTPLLPLTPNSFFLVQVTAGATDAAGNPLAAPFASGFQTGP